MSVDLKSEVISFKLSLISIVFIMLITVLFLNAPGINKGLAGSGISCSEICAERSGKDFCLPENVGVSFREAVMLVQETAIVLKN